MCALLRNYPEFVILSDTEEYRAKSASIGEQHPDVCLVILTPSQDLSDSIGDFAIVDTANAPRVGVVLFEESHEFQRQLRHFVQVVLSAEDLDIHLYRGIIALSLSKSFHSPRLRCLRRHCPAVADDQSVAPRKSSEQDAGVRPLSEISRPVNTVRNLDCLSARELEVALMVARGCRNCRIAENLYISIPTVKTHIANIFQKLSVTSRHEIIALVLNNDEIHQ